MGHEVETVKREVSQMKAEVNGIKNQIQVTNDNVMMTLQIMQELMKKQDKQEEAAVKREKNMATMSD